MNTISKTNLQKLSKEEIKRICPVVVTSDGDPVGVLGDPDDFVYIGGIHPQMRFKINGLLLAARGGMPVKLEYITAAEVKEEVENAQDATGNKS